MINSEELRQEYRARHFRRSDLLETPLALFAQWFKEAQLAQVREPNALCLATANRQGHPSSRMVLMKEFSAAGLVFYTSEKSRKGSDISVNPYVAATFWWPELERQVQIRGTVHKISKEKADHYFHSRPRNSQLGALASQQDTPIASRDILETELKRLQSVYKEGIIPRPEFWGGYCIVADYFEFWQGRENRLHDRFAFSLTHAQWEITRLSP